jgi:hypothetical protein
MRRLLTILTVVTVVGAASGADLKFVWENPANHVDGTALDYPAMARISYVPATLMLQYGAPMSGVRVVTNYWLAPLPGAAATVLTLEMTNNYATEQLVTITGLSSKVYAAWVQAGCAHGWSSNSPVAYGPAGSPASTTIRVSK